MDTRWLCFLSPSAGHTNAGVQFLQAGFHASLSSLLDDDLAMGQGALSSQVPGSNTQPSASETPPIRPAWEGTGALPRIALAYGPACLSLTTFLVAVLDCDRSILGGLYILLATIVLVSSMEALANLQICYRIERGCTCPASYAAVPVTHRFIHLDVAVGRNLPMREVT